MKKFILAIYHFLPTIICIVIATIIAVYFQVETLGAVLLGAFFTLVQPFIEKMREIGQQLEAERQALESSAPHQIDEKRLLQQSLPEESLRVKERSGSVQPRRPHKTRTETKTGRPPANWPGIFAIAAKPILVLVGILALIVAGWCVYLYFYFYP